MTIKKEQVSLKEKLYSKYKKEKKVFKKRVIKTSITSLNRALTVGGIPAGSIIEIYGPEGYGKTTLAGRIAADMINAGHEVCFFDIENSLDDVYYRSLGVDFDKAEIFSTTYIEDLTIMVRDMMKNFREAKEQKIIDEDKCFFIFLDTITNAIPRDEDADTIAKGYPIEAILITKFTKRVLALAGNDITIVCINQVRDNLRKKSLYDVDKVSAGANAFKHNVSVRFEMRGKSKDYDNPSKSLMCGYKLKIIAKKAKCVGIDHQEMTLFIANGMGKAPMGLDDAKEAVNEAINRGVIKQEGRKVYSSHLDREFNGIHKAFDYYRDNADDLQGLKDILDTMVIEEYSKMTEDFSLVKTQEEKPKRRTKRRSERNV